MRAYCTALFLWTGAALGAQPESNEMAFSLPQTQVVDITDSTAKRHFQLYVRLPDAYFDPGREQATFPAVYVTDASYNFPMIEGFVRIPTGQGRMEPAILVGISWETGADPIDSRVRDYTPTVNKDFERETGGADAHLRFIRDEVFPYVETHFRGDPGQRIYVGYSLGGLLGAYALLTQPELFKDYLLASPSLWFDDRYVLRLEADGAARKPLGHKRIFISAGEYETPQFADIKNDLVADARTFQHRLLAWSLGNVEAKLHVVDGAVHEIAFPEPMARGLYWFLGASSGKPRK